MLEGDVPFKGFLTLPGAQPPVAGTDLALRPDMTRTSYLSRLDFQQRTDRATRSVILEYTGHRLRFHTHVYGYGDGVFYVVNLDEVPYPRLLEEMAQSFCLDLSAMADAGALRQAAAAALAAGAMVDAPDLLAEMADPRSAWLPSDRRFLERRHMIAAARVTELTRMMEADIRRRMEPCAPPPEPVVVAPVPPSWGAQWSPTLVQPSPAPVPMAAPGPSPEPEMEPEGEVLEPTSHIVVRAQEGVIKAREAELPQRMPGGVRGRLAKMPPGVYVSSGDVLDGRLNLCAALTDARARGRKDREATVIDWDGEWPVAVRRYGQGGRVIYTVEGALRRAGIALTKETSG